MPRRPADRTIQRWGHLWCGLLVIGLLGTAARLVYIQTVLRDDLLEYGVDQKRRVIELPTRRGMIFDAEGRILAGSHTEPSVYADPALIPDLEAVCAQLAPILDTPAAHLSRRLQNHRERRFCWLSRRITAAQAHAIQSLGIPGLVVIDEPARDYPNGALAAHVLGFVDSDCKGLEGLELKYEQILAGSPGRYAAACDARRSPIWPLPHTFEAPSDGGHVLLTLDAVIQGHAERILAQTVQEYSAESGVALVMDPATGDVLAMASYPGFDPNDHAAAPADHRRNRCLTDPVEPGSCFKPFIMSAALAEKVARLDERLDCGQGVHYFGGRRLRDTHANGTMTFEEVLIKSSNIGMGIIGTRLGNRLQYAYVNSFGFGQPTGIELPGEDAGIIPPLRQWTSYSTTSVPMGQEIAVTPIQLITAFCALVNGGEWIQPSIVRAMLTADGADLDVLTERRRRRVLPPATARAVAQRAMVHVIEQSAHDVHLAGWPLLGKTGTAQLPARSRRGYEPGAYLSSFMAAAPADDPVVAALIMIRKPDVRKGYYGGAVAGPACRDLIGHTLAYRQVPMRTTANQVATTAVQDR